MSRRGGATWGAASDRLGSRVGQASPRQPFPLRQRQPIGSGREQGHRVLARLPLRCGRRPSCSRQARFLPFVAWEAATETCSRAAPIGAPTEGGGGDVCGGARSASKIRPQSRDPRSIGPDPFLAGLAIGRGRGEGSPRGVPMIPRCVVHPSFDAALHVCLLQYASDDFARG
jgi:hypothetical protein